MSSIFNVISIEQGLAVVRIALGLWWLKSVFHKPLREMVEGKLVDWVIDLADNHPWPFWGRLIKGIVEPTRSWFAYLSIIGELAVGIGLTFGFLTPISLAVAILMNFNYIVLAGARPNDISVNRAYQCEQGQNWNMIIPELVLLLTGAWATWSVDAALGLFT